MLLQNKPEDFVITTGIQVTVREFIIRRAKKIGITLKFGGVAENEKAIVAAIEGDKAPASKVGDVILSKLILATIALLKSRPSWGALLKQKRNSVGFQRLP